MNSPGRTTAQQAEQKWEGRHWKNENHRFTFYLEWLEVPGKRVNKAPEIIKNKPTKTNHNLFTPEISALEEELCPCDYTGDW